MKIKNVAILFLRVEHLTSHQWHPGITGDTSSICANTHVGGRQEGDTHIESETSLQECGTRRKYSDLRSEVEANNKSKKPKHDSKKKEGILYKCKICSKSISRKENLVIHNRIHTGEKPFRCEICNKSFIRRDGLVRHTRIHTGDKPFSCEVCNKGFIQRGDLVVHTRTHTGEKPFKCRICNKRFKQSAVLASHSRIHTGDKCFKCDVCNKEFTQHGGLVRHTRSHSGDKPFSCKVCSKRFAMRGDLVRHSRIHTRDKGDDSEGCDMGFTRCADPEFDIYSRTGDHVFSSWVFSTFSHATEVFSVTFVPILQLSSMTFCYCMEILCASQTGMPIFIFKTNISTVKKCN